MPIKDKCKTNKTIEIGKFYLIHDGSRTGHPGYVIWKDDEKNRYLVIRFDSDKFGDIPKKDRGVKHITLLSKPTSKEVLNSYVRNRPTLCKRRDIGILMKGLTIALEDLPLINEITKRKVELSKSIKRKRNYKK